MTMNLHEELKMGVQHHQANQLGRAQEIYAEILKIHPRHPEALHLLGLIAYQTGQSGKAIDLIGQAIQIAPDSPVYYNNLANAYSRENKLDKALECYENAVKLKPDYPEALFGMGNVCQTLEDYQKAIECYRRALDIKPNFHQACNNMGVAFFETGNFKEASRCYQKAIQIQPDYYEAYTNLGNTYKAQGQFRTANDWYYKAMEINSDCAEAYANLGFSLHQMGRVNDALASYQKALKINPNYGEVYNDLGTLYRELSRPEQALACFKKSAELKPQNPEVYNNIGIVYKERGRYQEAIASYQKALQLDPDFTESHYNLGNAFGKCGNPEDAIAAYRKAIQLRPDHAFAFNMLVRQLQQLCAWTELEMPVTELVALNQKNLTKGLRAAEMPFLTFSLTDDTAYNYEVAKSWSDEVSARIQDSDVFFGKSDLFAAGRRDREKSRITIGYLSADFQNHATVHLMGSLFGYHDHRKFKINAYSYGKNDHSHYRSKIEQDCDQFADIFDLSDFEAAHKINSDGVDILVDLKGHTDASRLGISAYRPAPVQVTWLGFPGTTGAEFLDYIITDKITSPSEHASYFTEHFAYMPHTYQVNDCHQKIAPDEFSRQEFGLPQDGFVFCSFNEPYKIEPVLFNVWIRVLQQVPSSVLWLIRKGRHVEERLKKEAEGRGVARQRLVFADKLPKDKHLARYKLADLCLDTRLVNGHTTTSDALWAGVPVVTLLGNHFASRVSASLLTAVGLPELVTKTLSDYERLAVHLAVNGDYLEKIKNKLAENRKHAPLFDTVKFTENLEKAYKKMWQIYESGEKPRQIEVLDDVDRV
jgi:protein O-GlcNAc transferase